MTPQETNKINTEYEEVLREARDWYGSWDDVRRVIDALAMEDDERAFERSMQDYGPNAAEIAERQHKNQLLK